MTDSNLILCRASGWLAAPDGESRESTISLIKELVELVKGLEGDLRMVRSGRDSFSKLIEERGLRSPKEATARNRRRS